jgi:hypothetical protein
VVLICYVHFLSSIIFLFFYSSYNLPLGRQPLSHESMGHNRSLGYVKGFIMEDVKNGRERNAIVARAPQYYPFSLGGDNTGLGYKS